jgi:hypothetical protein
MAGGSYVVLRNRGLMTVTGEDAGPFLQGLISNDIEKLATDRAIYAAFLTPQGKYLHDFFIARIGETPYLDCEAGRLDDLRRRLCMYKLRSKVSVEAAGDGFVVAALFGPGAIGALGLDQEPGRAAPFAGGIVYVDPRLAAVGARAILPADIATTALEEAGFAAAEAAAYDRLRLTHGLPDGSRDLAVERAMLLESNFDELNGIDWDKGCYLGQELTARIHYRGLVKKRLMPVEIEGPPPEVGTQVMLGDRNVGEMRSALDGQGLALLRLEAVAEAEREGRALTAGRARLKPRKPDWASF